MHSDGVSNMGFGQVTKGLGGSNCIYSIVNRCDHPRHTYIAKLLYAKTV